MTPEQQEHLTGIKRRFPEYKKPERIPIYSGPLRHAFNVELEMAWLINTLDVVESELKELKNANNAVS